MRYNYILSVSSFSFFLLFIFMSYVIFFFLCTIFVILSVISFFPALFLYYFVRFQSTYHKMSKILCLYFFFSLFFSPSLSLLMYQQDVKLFIHPRWQLIKENCLHQEFIWYYSTMLYHNNLIFYATKYIFILQLINFAVL